MVMYAVVILGLQCHGLTCIHGLFDVTDCAIVLTALLSYMYWHNWASTRETLSSGFPTKQYSNQSIQLHGLARKLRFRLK